MLTGRLPRDIPANPSNTYAETGWKSYGDWLGTGRLAYRLRECRPFREARAFAQKLKLRTGTEWRAFCRGEMPTLGRLPEDIPASPHFTYAEKGWRSYGDWLGTGTVATFLREYRAFPRARAFVRGLKLKSASEWRKFCGGEMVRLGELPADIPSNPYKTYADKGWKSWGDWLGTETVALRLRDFRSFKKARSFARELELKSGSKWGAYCKGKMPRLGRLPGDIPAHPRQKYAAKSWKGMGDWLGTGTTATQLRKYRPFHEARAFAHKLKLKSGDEWHVFCKGKTPALGRLPTDIPAVPWLVYADKGWKGMGDWLGWARAQSRHVSRNFARFEKPALLPANSDSPAPQSG